MPICQVRTGEFAHYEEGLAQAALRDLQGLCGAVNPPSDDAEIAVGDSLVVDVAKFPARSAERKAAAYIFPNAKLKRNQRMFF